jgi:hypothetical protein
VAIREPLVSFKIRTYAVSSLISRLFQEEHGARRADSVTQRCRRPTLLHPQASPPRPPTEINRTHTNFITSYKLFALRPSA